MTAITDRSLCGAQIELSCWQEREEILGKELTMLGYVSKLRSKLRAPSVEEREIAYLNQSVDRVDLEYRQRQIDRGLFRKRPLNFL
jgi:hypothetical protein